MCKLFRASSIIDSGYRFILVLYHHYFGPNSETVPKSYPHWIDLHWDKTKEKKMQTKKKDNDDVIFLKPILDKKVDLLMGNSADDDHRTWQW